MLLVNPPDAARKRCTCVLAWWNRPAEDQPYDPP